MAFSSSAIACNGKDCDQMEAPSTYFACPYCFEGMCARCAQKECASCGAPPNTDEGAYSTMLHTATTCEDPKRRALATLNVITAEMHSVGCDEGAPGAKRALEVDIVGPLQGTVWHGHACCVTAVAHMQANKPHAVRTALDLYAQAPDNAAATFGYAMCLAALMEDAHEDLIKSIQLLTKVIDAKGTVGGPIPVLVEKAEQFRATAYARAFKLSLENKNVEERKKQQLALWRERLW